MAMVEDEEERWMTEAARTLLSLQYRPVKRWPEWRPRPSEEQLAAVAEVVEVEVPQGWPKACRRLAQERPKAAAAWRFGRANFLAGMRYGAVVVGSGAPRGGVDASRSQPPPPPRVREKPEVHAELVASPESSTVPRHDGAAAGSGPGPSTRGAGHASEEAKAEVEARKDAKEKASSPDTPLEYGAAAGESGASSGGEDAAPRSPAKSKASGGDEACSSPAKRARADAVAAGAGDQATPAADKVEEEADKTRSDYRDENGCLLFDLNNDAPLEED